MSGSIHSKGVLTLNGYMGAQYAQDNPFVTTASLTLSKAIRVSKEIVLPVQNYMHYYLVYQICLFIRE